MSKTVRVYTTVTTQAAFDVTVEDDDDIDVDSMYDAINAKDITPVYVDESAVQLGKVLGVVSEKNIFGTTFVENMAELDRRILLASEKVINEAAEVGEEDE
jgi:hypothetical protein